MIRRLALVGLLASCGGPRDPSPPTPPPTTADDPVVVSPVPDPEPVAEPEPPAEPAPTTTLVGEVSRYGVVSLSVANRAEAPTRLSLRLGLEREADGSFVTADDLGAFDLARVGDDDDGCSDLVSGGELRGSWPCLRGDAADPHACTPAPAGTYRFVVSSCDGRSRTEGEPFVYPL